MGEVRSDGSSDHCRVVAGLSKLHQPYVYVSSEPESDIGIGIGIALATDLM